MDVTALFACLRLRFSDWVWVIMDMVWENAMREYLVRDILAICDWTKLWGLVHYNHCWLTLKEEDQ